MKRFLRDATWTLRGRSIVNPPVPPNVQSVLFVCLGNICRSPFGAGLAARFLADAGLGHIRCESAGIRTSEVARSPQEAVEVSAAYGVWLAEHRPRQLTAELARSSDLIVVMECSQFEYLRAVYPDCRDRIVLLSLYDITAAGSYERYNIRDPFGHPREAYEDCYSRIRRAARSLVAALSPRESFK
jgi:protein-tyrosine phosphatase